MPSNTKNTPLFKTELAAGFPPYTRGYKAFDFETKTITPNKEGAYDFELKSYSEDAIIDLFKQIIANPTLNKELSLFFGVPINIDLVSATRAIRTVLALINQHQKKEASSSCFKFYSKGQEIDNLLIEYHFVKASQIDFFILSKKAQTLLKNVPETKIPIDPFFGNPNLDHATNTLINNVWEQIEPLL